MNRKALVLRKLAFLGPGKEAAVLKFKKGVNVVCGASDTGKSFLIEAIDFMLGGSKELRDIPQRVGFDRIRLAIETSTEDEYTFERSSDGGGFNLYDGILDEQLQIDGGQRIKKQHGHGATDNISGWLLDNIDLLEKVLRKNAQGVTRSLSFRDLARLVVVDESEIIRSTSPFLSGQFITKTVEYSTLKLLLTGADDSAIVPGELQESKLIGVSAKIELLEQWISDLSDEITDKNLDEDELNEQTDKLLVAIEIKKNEMSTFQSTLNESISSRRELLETKEGIKNRVGEVEEMMGRFNLLKKHYLIDVERLMAVEETGSLFVHYEKVPCPLCGSLSEETHSVEDCDGNIEEVVFAAKKEIEKIQCLLADLEGTVDEFSSEMKNLTPKLEGIEEQYKIVDEKIREAISPDFQKSQVDYTILMEKKNEVSLSLEMFNRLLKLEQQKQELDNAEDEVIEEVKPTKLSKMTLNEFSKTIENILKAWDFPDASDVYFDETVRDLVISGKPRGSRGKGLRAITHAAVTIGLLEYCKEKSLPHPGFVVLDSPLLAYYKPEGEDDNLQGTNLKEKFYEYLIQNHSDSQIIIVENEHPSEEVETQVNLTVFTKNPHEGRFGLFPVENN